jgi:hypothetical protein
MEGEFDMFGEAFSFDDLNPGEMVGELNALRIGGRCDLRCVCSSTFTDGAAHSDHLGEVARAHGASEDQSVAGSVNSVGERPQRALGQRTGGFRDRQFVDGPHYRQNGSRAIVMTLCVVVRGCEGSPGFRAR